jgi:hypothetical protein
MRNLRKPFICRLFVINRSNNSSVSTPQFTLLVAQLFRSSQNGSGVLLIGPMQLYLDVLQTWVIRRKMRRNKQATSACHSHHHHAKQLSLRLELPCKVASIDHHVRMKRVIRGMCGVVDGAVSAI